MQTLKLNENDDLTDAELLDARVPMRFWTRQFHLEPTSRQRRFDWAFGVVLPTICVAADPIVFSSFLGEGDACGDGRSEGRGGGKAAAGQKCNRHPDSSVCDRIR